MKKFNPPVYTTLAGALINATMKSPDLDKKVDPPVYTTLAGALINAAMKSPDLDKKVDHKHGPTVAQRVGANYLDGVGRTTLRAKR